MWKSVSRCQWLPWTHLFSFLFAGALGDWVFREVVRWPCQTPLILLKPGWMEVRLSANQNVSLMVCRDEVLLWHPIDHGSARTHTRSLFITQTGDCSSLVDTRSLRHEGGMKTPKLWVALAPPLLTWETVECSTVNPVCKILLHQSVVTMPVVSLSVSWLSRCRSVFSTLWYSS